MDGPTFDKGGIVEADRSVWRYRNFIARRGSGEPVTLGEGWTPLVATRTKGVYAKLDFMMPTGSYKDRGTTVLISSVRHLVEQGPYEKVTEESSGNAGASVAAYAARAGLRCEIYTPLKVRGGKARQIEAYGATVKRVPGGVVAISRAAQTAEGGLYISHAWNPFFQEGTKTIAYEVGEQTGWDPPEYFFIPTSAGSLLLGVIKGFREMAEGGFIERVPLLVAVQSEQVSPVYHGVKGKPYTPPPAVTTVADALISTEPIRLAEMVQELKAIGGDAEVVSDEAILAAQRDLAREGLYVEPSSAVTLAAWRKWVDEGRIKPGERTLLLLTGSGLKAAG